MCSSDLAEVDKALGFEPGESAEDGWAKLRQLDESGPAGDAQIRLTMTSDDLLALVDGSLHLASAWATGRIKVEAGVRDLLKLRSIF